MPRLGMCLRFAGPVAVVAAGLAFLAMPAPVAEAHGGRIVTPPPPPPAPPPIPPRPPVHPKPPPPTPPPRGEAPVPPTTPSEPVPTPPPPAGRLPGSPPTTPTDPTPPTPTKGDDPRDPVRSRRGRPRPAVSQGGWKEWWDVHGDSLRLGRGDARPVTPESPLFRVGDSETGGGSSAHDPDRATRRAVVRDVLPALLHALDPANRCDPDTVATAWLAWAKVATGPADVERLLAAARRRDLPSQVHEAAVLALGLLRRTGPEDAFDGRTLDGVRAVLFAVLDDELPTRTRCFAAIALGLLGDQASDDSDPFARGGRETVRGLWTRLREKSAGDEVPVALLVALSRQRPDAVPSGVLEGLRSLAVFGRLEGRSIGRAARAHAVTALACLMPREGGAGVFLGLLAARGTDEDVRRSAVLALGDGARSLDPTTRVETARRLCDAARACDRDTTGLVFVALAQVLAADFAAGSDAVAAGSAADETLLKAVAGGTFDHRPFAALALGIAAAPSRAARDVEAFASFRARALEALRRGAGEEGSDPDSRGAYCLALGLLEDEGSVELLRSVVVRRGAVESLRAHACAALGFVGTRTPETLAVLRTAVADRSSDPVRREAARALGMLGDVSAVPGLVKELGAGGSDHALARIVLAIGSIRDASAIAPLAALVRGRASSDSVRALACAGLGCLGDLEPTPSLSALAARVNYLARTDALHEALSIL